MALEESSELKNDLDASTDNNSEQTKISPSTADSNTVRLDNNCKNPQLHNSDLQTIQNPTFSCIVRNTKLIIDSDNNAKTSPAQYNIVEVDVKNSPHACTSRENQLNVTVLNLDACVNSSQKAQNIFYYNHCREEKIAKNRSIFTKANKNEDTRLEKKKLCLECLKINEQSSNVSRVINVQSKPSQNGLQSNLDLSERYQCHCGEKFRTNEKLLRHYKSHQKQKNPDTVLKKAYKCGICFKYFRKPMYLKAHMKTTHKEKKNVTNEKEQQKVVANTKCDGQSDNKTLNLNCFKSEQKTNLEHEKLECQKCRKPLHEQDTSNTNEFLRKKLHECKTCHEQFVNDTELKAHEKIHSEDARFLCEFCGRIFKKRTCFNIHVRIHTEFKPHVCKTCNKSFSTRSSMLQHATSHTKKSFRCNVCERFFRTSTALKNHLQFHTNEPFTCVFCNEKFFVQAKFVIHEKEHKGNKVYVCNICGEKYFVKNRYDTHMRQHSGQRPFQCGICNKYYISRKILKEHQKKVHMKKKNL